MIPVDNFYIFIFFVLIFTLGFVVGFFIKRQTNRFVSQTIKRKEANRSQKETPRRSNQTNRSQMLHSNTTIIRPTTNKAQQLIKDITQ